MQHKKNNLFREQVQDTYKNKYFGTVIIHQPISSLICTIIILSLITTVVSFSYFGMYTKKAKAHGLLATEKGVLKLLAPNSGTLIDIKALEGKTIQAGQPLFILSNDRYTTSGETNNQILAQIENRIQTLEKRKIESSNNLQLRTASLNKRLQAIEDEKRQLNIELTLLDKRAAISQNNLNRSKELLNKGFISPAQYQKEEDEYLILQSQKQNSIRINIGLEKEKIEVISQLNQENNQFKKEEADISHNRSLLTQEVAENELRKNQIIIAPFNGLITGLNVEIGQKVSENALLASFIPINEKLIAKVYINSGKIGFIRPGQKVLLRYAAYPYQKFGMASGKIKHITQSPYALQELHPQIASIMNVNEHGDLYYQVDIALDAQTIMAYGKAQKLRPGMLLEADIQLETRRLYEWILEPIYSITGK